MSQSFWPCFVELMVAVKDLLGPTLVDAKNLGGRTRFETIAPLTVKNLAIVPPSHIALTSWLCLLVTDGF